jgi:hypothetical protein
MQDQQLSYDCNDRLVFIITHKYFRQYENYLKYYIDNITKFYPNALIIVVDNNSPYKDENFSRIEKRDNIILLDNNIECKFEYGGYQVGIKYLLDNNLLTNFDYIICAQDTFVLKNRYDFNNLKRDNVLACPLNSFHQDQHYAPEREAMLNHLGINNNMDKVTFCWCNSFIVATSKAEYLYNRFLTRMVLTASVHREYTERYFARVLWELNDYRNYDIDGDIMNLPYDCHSVDIPNATVTTYFAKRAQQKNEHTSNI